VPLVIVLILMRQRNLKKNIYENMNVRVWFNPKSRFSRLSK